MKIYFILFLLIAACKPEPIVKGGGFTINQPGNEPIAPTTGTSFTLMSPASTPGNNSTISFSINGVVSGETINVYSDSACSVLVKSELAANTSVSISISSLTVGAHSFYTNSTNNLKTSNCSTTHLSYNYLGIAPTRATAIALYNPVSSPGIISTPTFLISGVVSGETISLFIDSSCIHSVGSTLATGTSVQVTSSALAPGNYSFYTSSSNSAGTSSCSGFNATYSFSGVIPSSATSIILITPSSSPNYATRPVFRISGGVAPGDEVGLYTNSTCSISVGSAVATGSSVDITITALVSSGVYQFYTKSISIAGVSSCSNALANYNYLGAAPVIQVSWLTNKEKGVNQLGGGYRVYYSTSPGIDTTSPSATFVNVPYVSGANTPTSITFNNFLVGSYHFKIVAYSNISSYGATGGTTSEPSSEFSVSLP